MKTVLVTGATGFIGKHCLSPLLEKGYIVHGVSSKILKTTPSTVHWHQCDLLNAAQVSALLSEVRPTMLLHMAWFTKPGKYWSAIENLEWVRASLNLVQLFAHYGGQRVVMAGTCAEYDWNYGFCSETVTPLAPTSLYGTSKSCLQTLVSAFGKEAKLSAAWGRIFFLYGPDEHPNRLVSSVISTLLQSKPTLCSHGQQIRDFLFVKDVANALVTLLDSDVTGPVNIASGYPIALKDVIYKIAKKLDKENLVQLGAIPVLATEPPLLVADISRLRNEVGWQPKYDLDKGLSKTIEWWKIHLNLPLSG